jgi:hypothetical protein
VDHVGEQRHRARNNEHKKLNDRGDRENGEYDRDSLDAFARTEDRAVDQAVRVTVLAVIVVVVVIDSAVGLVLANAYPLRSWRSTRPSRKCSTWKTAWSSRSATCESWSA